MLRRSSQLDLEYDSQVAISTETLESMQLWVPIAAAAVCSYLGGRFAAKVRARYTPPPPEPESAHPEL